VPVPPSSGDFLVTIDDKQIGRRFQLSGDPSGYRVDVTRSSAVKRWVGIAMIPASVIVGVGIGIIPVLHNVPRSSTIGYAAGGTAIAVLGIGGGVTLFMFSRAKVKVFPGLAAAPSNGGHAQ
jgi:hypothetical protein